MDAPGHTPDPEARTEPAADAPLPPALAAALDQDEGLEERVGRIGALSPPASRYTLLGEIGRGGMGRVLRVWDEALQRELAMKVVSAPAGADEESTRDHERIVSRFVEEARLTGQLDHPGVVPVHEIALDGEGHLYFTMPLVRGRTLEEVLELARAGTEGWTLPGALGVLRQVCQTVAFAHARGVIHRDLKPQNVMVGPYGEVYVMDWGLALVQDRARPRSVVGTPAYMAPEQASAPESVGLRADVYSLGAILYRLLGGRVPHQRTIEENPGTTTVDALIQATPRPVEELDPDAPPELVAVCAKAMARDPEERYASAGELAEELSAWLERRVVRAYRTDRLWHIKLWRERNRALSRALEALVLLALVSAIVVSGSLLSRLHAVQAANARSEASTYAANLHAASLHLRSFEMNDARLRLEACPPKLRGWEWGFLELCTDASARVLPGGGVEVGAVAVDLERDLVAAGADDGSVRLWSAAGELLHVLPGHEEAVLDLAFVPGTALLASTSLDRTVRLWNTATGEAVRRMAGVEDRAATLAASPDGTRLAIGTRDGKVAVRRLSDDGLVTTLPRAAGAVTALDFGPAGETLYVGDLTGRVRLWDLAEHRLRQEALIGSGPLRDLDSSDDGTTLVAAIEDDAVSLDPQELSRLGTLTGHEGVVLAVALDAEGRLLLTAGTDYTLRLWDLATRAPLGTFAGHIDEVNAAAFLPDGAFVSGAEDGTVRLWSSEREAIRRIGAHEGWATAMSFSPDGERLATTGRDRHLRIWSVRDGSLLEEVALESSSDVVAWMPGGRLLFGGGDGALRITTPGSGAPWEVLEGADQHPATVAVHADSGRICAATLSHRLLLWDDTSPRPRVLEGAEEVYAAAFHPSGEVLAIGGAEGRLELLRWSDGARLRRLEGAGTERINAIAFADGAPLLAAGTADRSLLVWSTETGELVRRAEGHESQLTALAFAPDGARIASGSVDRTVRVWDPLEGEALLTLREHASGVTALAFAAQGDALASASKDGTVRVYRTRLR